jgi:hypothetical protein
VREGTFVFLTPRFDGERPALTGITADQLYRGLTKMSCRSVVLLSACHAGDATRWTPREPVRDLFPGGIGPIVVSAARHNETAIADARGSLFAKAIVEALDDKLAIAARGKAQLETRDFVAYLQNRVVEMHAELRRTGELPSDGSRTQTPVFFPEPAEMEAFPLARAASAK